MSTVGDLPSDTAPGAAPSGDSPRALAHDPLADTDTLLARFYTPSGAVRDGVRGDGDDPRRTKARPRRTRSTEKPAHYKVVCISLYTEDIERLAALVQELKRRGHRKVNKSQVIRAALDQIDLDRVPKGI